MSASNANCDVLKDLAAGAAIDGDAFDFECFDPAAFSLPAKPSQTSPQRPAASDAAVKAEQPLFQNGAPIEPIGERFTVFWSIANPRAQMNMPLQQLGGALVVGDQTSFIKFVATLRGSSPRFQIALEENDIVEYAELFDAPELYDAEAGTKILFAIGVDRKAAIAQPKAFFQKCVNGPATTVSGPTFSLADSGFLAALESRRAPDGAAPILFVAPYSSNPLDPERAATGLELGDVQLVPAQAAAVRPTAATTATPARTDASTSVKPQGDVDAAKGRSADADAQQRDQTTAAAPTTQERPTTGETTPNEKPADEPVAGEQVVYETKTIAALPAAPDLEFALDEFELDETEKEPASAAPTYEDGAANASSAVEATTANAHPSSQVRETQPEQTTAADDAAAEEPSRDAPLDTAPEAEGAADAPVGEDAKRAPIEALIAAFAAKPTAAKNRSLGEQIVKSSSPEAAPTRESGSETKTKTAPHVETPAKAKFETETDAQPERAPLIEAPVAVAAAAAPETPKLPRVRVPAAGRRLAAPKPAQPAMAPTPIAAPVAHFTPAAAPTVLSPALAFPTVSIVAGAVEVSPSTGRAKILIAASAPAPANATIDVALEISPNAATPGETGDYQCCSSSAILNTSTGVYIDIVSIAPGASTTSIEIAIDDDWLADGAEAFELRITGVTSANASIEHGSAVASIGARGTVSLAIADDAEAA